MKKITVDSNGKTNVKAGSFIKTPEEVFLIARMTGDTIGAFVFWETSAEWTFSRRAASGTRDGIERTELLNLFDRPHWTLDSISILEPHEVAEFFAKKAGGSFVKRNPMEVLREGFGEYMGWSAPKKIIATFYADYSGEFLDFYSEGDYLWLNWDGTKARLQGSRRWTLSTYREDGMGVEIPAGSRQGPPQFVSWEGWTYAYYELNGKKYVAVRLDGQKDTSRTITVKEALEEVGLGIRKVLTESEAKARLKPEPKKAIATFYDPQSKRFMEFFSDTDYVFLKSDGTAVDRSLYSLGWNLSTVRSSHFVWQDTVEIPTGSRQVPPQFISLGNWVSKPGESKAAYRKLDGKNYVTIMKDGSTGNCVNPVKVVMEELARGERKVLTEAEAKALLTPPDAYFVRDTGENTKVFRKFIGEEAWVSARSRGTYVDFTSSSMEVSDYRVGGCLYRDYREVSKAEFDSIIAKWTTPEKKPTNVRTFLDPDDQDQPFWEIDLDTKKSVWISNDGERKESLNHSVDDLLRIFPECIELTPGSRDPKDVLVKPLKYTYYLERNTNNVYRLEGSTKVFQWCSYCDSFHIDMSDAIVLGQTWKYDIISKSRAERIVGHKITE